jgi:N6-L-threonylcarbamoyladenine synthase
MRVLGIETSCDETAAAVVEDGTTILSNEIASQVDIHARYGGIVPEVASRQHTLAIVPIIKQALHNAGITWDDIDGIAVTMGPGLAGSLLTGVNTAKAISLARSLPIIGINHLEAHIYANWLDGSIPEFPFICLVVSGGHSDLVLVRGHDDYALLGQTRDDAAGEAFDKASRLLNLGYPGGPAIERTARAGRPSIPLPHAWLRGTSDFSFSGLKTALLRLVEDNRVSSPEDAAASFQKAITDVLVTKTVAAARDHRVRQVLLAGGVAANSALRQALTDASPFPVIIPPPILCTDNAAMVAACGYFKLRSGQGEGLNMDVIPNLRLS